MSGLQVVGLTVRFGDTVAVDDVSLDVRPGEVLAVLGPSGCGKSSLLRAVAGLEDTDPGSVRWDGAQVGDVPVHQRGFGLVFQDGQLFPHRSVAGNVEFGLRMAGVDRAERRARVGELLMTVGLEAFGDRPVSTLSGGEQQRVALARSLAPWPRLLLLDEPLSALDRSLRERLAEELRQILLRAHATALYVTHDQEEAFTVADRIAVMAQGRLLQTATPLALWRWPASQQVARFLGYRTFVRTAELGVYVDGAKPDDLLALRAESLVLDPDGPVRAVMLDRRVVRDGLVVRARIEELGDVDAVSADALAPEWADLGSGDEVRLRVEPGAVGVVGGVPLPEWQS